MASNHDMLRLIRAAADQLDTVDPTRNADAVIMCSPIDGEQLAALRRAAQEQIAIAQAVTVLRMVAAWLDDDPARPVSGAPLVEPPPMADPALRLRTFDERERSVR